MCGLYSVIRIETAQYVFRFAYFLLHTTEPPICLYYGEYRDKLSQKQFISRMYEPNQNEIRIIFFIR